MSLLWLRDSASGLGYPDNLSKVTGIGEFATHFVTFLFLGCGGTFNQSHGMFNLSKSDWDRRECTWKIYNAGLHNAVLLMSIDELRFRNCGHE